MPTRLLSVLAIVIPPDKSTSPVQLIETLPVPRGPLVTVPPVGVSSKVTAYVFWNFAELLFQLAVVLRSHVPVPLVAAPDQTRTFGVTTRSTLPLLVPVLLNEYVKLPGAVPMENVLLNVAKP